MMCKDKICQKVKKYNMISNNMIKKIGMSIIKEV